MIKSPAGAKETFVVEAQLGFILPAVQAELRKHLDCSSVTAELGFVQTID